MPLATYSALDDLGGVIGVVQFTLLLSAAARGGEAAVDDRHIPGGDNNFIDLGGQLTRTMEGEALFADYGTFTAIEGFRGGPGTLEYAEDTLSVVLHKVARRKATGRGPQYASLSFKLL